MTFSKQFPQTITTSDTSIPTIPNFRIENPLKKTVFCNAIELVTSPEFSRKGVLIIRVNNVDLYDSRKQNAFTNVAKMAIPLDAELERDRFVEIFVFNDVDSNLITCNVTIFLDEFSKSLDSSFQYISDNVVNTVVSEEEVIIPFENHFPSTEIFKLIDMKGYKSFILNMAGQAYVSPTLISPVNVPPFTNTSNITDGVLSTSSGSTFTMTPVTNRTWVFTIDFGSSRLGNPSTRYAMAVQLGVTTRIFQGNFNVEFSTDNINYTPIDDTNNPLVVSIVGQSTFAFPTTTVDNSVNVNFRFIRFTIVFTTDVGTAGGSAFNMQIFEMFDGDALGGTASVSFEELDISDGIFNEFIPASEFGTVTVGNAVKVQVGNVSNLSQSGKTYLLPSTQTGFRAKFNVTSTGGITTGVSIRKVA